MKTNNEIITLDDAIKHCYEVAEKKCDDCGKEHLQLAKWLEELQRSREIISNQEAEIKVLKEIQKKVLSEQGSYTTNDKTVCGDCENLWLKTLLENKAEIDRLQNRIKYKNEHIARLRNLLLSAKSEHIRR